MDATTKTVVQGCAKASAEGQLNFGESVARLIGVGIERYHVDFVRNDTTFYLPNGDIEIIAGHAKTAAPAEHFSAAGVEAAVRGAQAGTLQYPAFRECALAAGCVGYIVSMVGRRVVYYGRTADIHIEWFPDVK